MGKQLVVSISGKSAVAKRIEGISIGFRSQRVNKAGRKVRRVIKNHESHLHRIP